MKIMLFLLSLFITLVATKVLCDEAVSGGEPARRSGLRVEDYGMVSACSSFINSEGVPGEWGTAMLAAMDRAGKDCFYNRADFSRICPRFSRFTEEKKTQFLLILFAALAYDESTCRPKVRAQAENGMAIGLFQLEEDVALRRGASRHPFCLQNLSLTSNTFQMECAAGTFSTNHCDTRDSGATLCKVAGSCGYWQELKRSSGEVSRMASRFPGCTK